MKVMKKRQLIDQVIRSTMISLGFVIFVFSIQMFKMEDTVKYSILFIASFIFSSILFYIIFRQQDELKTEREQLITMFRHVSDGILILDENKKIIEMNQTAKELLGEELLPHLFCNICRDTHGHFQICDYDQCFLHDEKVTYYELNLLNKTQDKIPVSVSTSTFIGPEKNPLTIISIRSLDEYRKNERHRIQNMITTSILKGQEEERKRLSRELHDGIGQSIFSVLLGLEYLNPILDNEETKLHVDNLRKTTKQILEEIRHLSVELRPSALDDLGLVAAIKSYIKTFGEAFGIQINFDFSGDKERLSSNIETALYRICQEALTNAAKYADTERIDLMLTKRDEEVILKVTDYGKGFMINDLDANNQGVGLYSMEERSSMLNGTFHITSELGKGTEIEVKIPRISNKGEDLK